MKFIFALRMIVASRPPKPLEQRQGTVMRIVGCATVAISAMVLAGCETTPQTRLTQLNMKDKQFSSAQCEKIRAKALTYDDKVPERVVTGLALGLVLGPFGLPFAAAVDVEQDEQRRIYNREITLRCVTGGRAIVKKQDAERQTPN